MTYPSQFAWNVTSNILIEFSHGPQLLTQKRMDFWEPAFLNKRKPSRDYRCMNNSLFDIADSAVALDVKYRHVCDIKILNCAMNIASIEYAFPYPQDASFDHETHPDSSSLRFISFSSS